MQNLEKYFLGIFHRRQFWAFSEDVKFLLVMSLLFGLKGGREERRESGRLMDATEETKN